jgi:hypothetical protein
MINTIRRTVIGFTAGLAVLVPTAAAHAAPTTAAAAATVTPSSISCNAQNLDWEIGLACFGSGASLYRAWALCPGNRTVVGPWESVGSDIFSWASCGANHFFSNWGVDLT